MICSLYAFIIKGMHAISSPLWGLSASGMRLSTGGMDWVPSLKDKGRLPEEKAAIF